MVCRLSGGRQENGLRALHAHVFVRRAHAPSKRLGSKLMVHLDRRTTREGKHLSAIHPLDRSMLLPGCCGAASWLKPTLNHHGDDSRRQGSEERGDQRGPAITQQACARRGDDTRGHSAVIVEPKIDRPRSKTVLGQARNICNQHRE